MKRLFTYLFLAVTLFVAGCSESFDDSKIWEKLDNLESRIAKLEELCKLMNTNISSLQTIVTALQNNDYVTGVTPITKDGETVGYTITFTKSEPITIYHGEDGKDGENGKDGADGKDGSTPVVGVKQDTDGIYYWTLNGDWLHDANGNKIQAQGSDGKDGVDGKNGITPQLKIENDYWYISYDNGASWTQLGKATGEDGKDGTDGINGEDGEDGDAFFQSVDTSDPNYVVFTLTDGTQIKIPTWFAFEKVQALCDQMNSDISNLQILIEAMEQRDYITNVSEIVQENSVIGYRIDFANSDSISIYNGQDGIDGETPQISIKQDTDSIYYWTLNGEWLLDSDGQKLRVRGVDGNDAIAPQLKIEGNYWFISYDNGTTWTKLGRATGNNGTNGADGTDGKDGVIVDVQETASEVTFTLSDGSWIIISKVGTPTDSNSIINFADSAVKAICVEKWDTNGDGEISYAEASYCQGIDIQGNEEIRYFTELQYFTQLCTISISDCPNLQTVVLPAYDPNYDVQYLIVNFDGCTSLSRINFPSHLDTIWMQYCYSLQSVTVPANCTDFRFSNCKNLESVVLCDGLTTIQRWAFAGCRSLVNITIPASVTSIGKEAFYGCTKLTHVYCKSKTPPTLGEDVFSDQTGSLTPMGEPINEPIGCTIYVPTESVEAYKSADGWKDYADYIEPYNF